jgi:L-glyceraldehyde 3-phosphate reductase
MIDRRVALRDERVSSALIGASSVGQLEQNVAALARLELTVEEPAEIDRHALDGAINVWAPRARAERPLPTPYPQAPVRGLAGGGTVRR